MYSDVTGTRSAEMVQRHYVASGTREIRFYTMIEVLVGSMDILPKYSRIYEPYQLLSRGMR
jgi:hypothetical protein